ncbi:HTH domain-containing protein [Streptomyces melanogenes]|uniref:HTH domain-containing protein n=1 Tax=Streptomyces melanogenes TaxID=67326 RepID=UPI00167D0C26|nr:HTH domain-containing protein [Streptomyces melanogenes]
MTASDLRIRVKPPDGRPSWSDPGPDLGGAPARASTIRDYATSGYLDKGVGLHGRRWWRRSAVQARQEAGDQRHHPELTGAGRRVGDPRNRAPRPRTDPRIEAVAAELAAGGPAVTSADLAERYGVSDRTAQRLLAAARRQGPVLPKLRRSDK